MADGESWVREASSGRSALPDLFAKGGLGSRGGGAASSPQLRFQPAAELGLPPGPGSCAGRPGRRRPAHLAGMALMGFL